MKTEKPKHDLRNPKPTDKPADKDEAHVAVIGEDRKFADQHPTPNDHGPDIVRPGTGAQATGQTTRS